MSDKAISVEASRLLNVPSVSLAIKAGREEARERCQVTIESVTEQLWKDREFARENKNPAAALAATMAVAKLHGLADGEGPPAAAVDLKLVLGNIDEDELMRRYAETIILRQQRRKRLTHAGNDRGKGSDLRP